MAYLNSIEINQFRGIKQLSVSDFSSINLIVGDNNSGKTSFLEAIQLLYVQPQLESIKNVINQRTMLNPTSSSFYTSFIKMFNLEQNDNLLAFDIFSQSNNGIRRIELNGHEESVSGEVALKKSSLTTSEKTKLKRSSELIPENAKIFSGNVITQIGKKTEKNSIKFTSLDNVSTTPVIKKEVHYIPSFGHLRFDLLQNIVGNPEYKKLSISILKQFDASIADICYTKTDDGVYMESVITEDGINMPFSVYGDGIKKILYILNRLFDTTDSILLVDEIETGLHKKYYDLLLPVIFALAKKLNVQLFIATHSIEVIDAILRYGDYENNNNNDPIKVITLKKLESGNDGNIVARNVTGKYVYDNRKAFEFEVRL